MGKLIVIDGLDGSGKATQAQMLCDALRAQGKTCRYLSFPMYERDSSALVRMYLGGALGQDPAQTNAYAASMFFAADRYVSYRTDWYKDYQDPDTIIVANRYSSANAVHQLSKLPREEWEGFLDWLWDFEFGRLEIPAPDTVIYLEMPPALARTLIHRRTAETGRVMDIHELDERHLDNSYAAALYAAERLGWCKIPCYDGERILSREEIAQRIQDALDGR